VTGECCSAAVALLSPRETVFLDSSSTAHFVAGRIVSWASA
jgi:DeoR/GlpR family transcriptional regulator of sugar metabolism